MRPELAVGPWNVNKADVSRPDDAERIQDGGPPAGGESLLFLTDDQLRRGIEAMFFAYRGFTADPDRILAERGYGRAHHRALHFVHRSPGIRVADLMEILGVTKQSLNRVLRTLVEDGLVESRPGTRDRRERRLRLTARGTELEAALSEAQRGRMRAAFREAGPGAVQGFRQVLEAMMDPDLRRYYQGPAGGDGAGKRP